MVSTMLHSSKSSSFVKIVGFDYTAIRRHAALVLTNYYYCVSTTVSPALGDCVKELRKIHSGFLSDLQQSFYDLTSENDKLMDEIGVGFDECAQLQNDNGLLQDAMSKLNAVIL